MKVKLKNVYGYPFMVSHVRPWAQKMKLKVVIGAENLKKGDCDVLLLESPAFLEAHGIEVLGYRKVGGRFCKTALPTSLVPNSKVLELFDDNERLPPKLLIEALKAEPKSALDFEAPHDKTLKKMLSRFLPPSLKDKFEPPKKATKAKDKKAGAF